MGNRLTVGLALNIVFMFLFVVFFSQVAHAEDENQKLAERIYSSKQLVLEQEITSVLRIPSGINRADVSLAFYPHPTFRQSVVSQETSPAAVQNDDLLLFRFQDPAAGNYPLRVTTRVLTVNDYLPIFDRVPYPIDTHAIPQEYQQYLLSSENIDINDAIREQARALAGESSDLFVISHTLASWVEENIQYDLSTVTEDVSQSASWTLEHRVGVCDELTSLFIAMMRSLHVPARYVSGVSYTNSPLFNNPWGPHAWAEVYFPGYGWVPFDITYKQFGHIDASHIQLKTSADADGSFTKYSWTGSGNKVVLDSLSFSTAIQRFSGAIDPAASIDASLLHDQIGLASKGLLQISLENNKDHYVSVPLIISTPQEVSSDDSAIVLLKPREKKTLYLVLSLDDGLDEQFIYTMPIVVSTQEGNEQELSLRVARQYPSYDQAYVNQYISSRANETTLVAECNAEPYAMAGEEFQYSCSVHTSLSLTGKVCIAKACENVAAGNQTVKLSPVLSYTAPGNYFIGVESYVGTRLQETLLVPLVVYDIPSVLLISAVPAHLTYDAVGEINVTISSEKGGLAQDLDLAVVVDGYTTHYEIPLLDKNYIVNLPVTGNDFRPGDNNVTLLLTYRDMFGHAYSQEKSHGVVVEVKNPIQYIYLYLKHFMRRVIPGG